MIQRTLPRRRLSRRGFSLIELGIVIAVIAVLAAVVIFGRGFILAARVTKAVDASNTIRKGASTFAGVNGGSLLGLTASQVTPLANRGLLPNSAVSGTWTVSGAAGSADAITVNYIGLGQTGGGSATGAQNAVAIRFVTTTATMAQDVMNAVKDDKNIVPGTPTIGGVACNNPTAAVTSATVVTCFFL